MTAQEHQLITELFARRNRTPSQAKDAGADQLIRNGVMENPQAPYLLVQTVLIQDMALSQAQHRVAELEQQLAEAKAGASAEPSACEPLRACVSADGADGSAACCRPGAGGIWSRRCVIGILAGRRRNRARRRGWSTALPGHPVDVRSARGKHPFRSIDAAAAQ